MAGPVSIGVFGAEEKMKKWLLKNIFDNKLRDSKKLSPKKREEIYKKFCELQKQKRITFFVCHISNKIIDKKGISYATRLGIKKSLKFFTFTNYPDFHDRAFLVNYKNLEIRLDGRLKAPGEYKNQKTIIKGDEKDIFIACASIVAKVRRDRLMCRLGGKFPLYAFPIHKGYGTKLHYSLLQKHGLSEIHRKSFCED